jgi:uncharacterized membrane protein YdbT with pleckstrin-like domain
MEQGHTSHSEHMHPSVFALAVRISFLQLLMALAIVVLNLSLFWLVGTGSSNGLLIALLSIGGVVLQTIDGAALIYLILQWASVSYSITEDEIIIRRGLVGLRTSEHKAHNLESAEVDQSLFGRLFNYGVLRFHDPGLGQDIILPDIPNPHRYTAIINQKKE